MTAPARKIAVDLDDWVPAAEAARLLGVSERRIRQIAAAQAARGLARLAAPSDGAGKPVWWVHRSADSRLSRRPTQGQEHAGLIERHAEHKVHAAYEKDRWLREWRRRCDRRRDGTTEIALAKRIVREAQAQEPSLRISVRTLKLWWSRYQREGLSALVDRRGETTPAERSEAARSSEAVEYFYGLYHTQSAQTVKGCHRATLHAANKQGWAWPRSYQAAWKWLERNDDRALTCLMRDPGQYTRRYLPHIRRSYHGLEPGAWYVSDHHQVDFWVVHQGKQLRPWLTAVQDLRSRRIVGWNLGAAPHQDAILAALSMAFRRAIPKKLTVDNGKDYTSRLIGPSRRTRDALRSELGADWRTSIIKGKHRVECVDPRWLGVTAELGVETIFATPYAPWSKGTLERWFGTFEAQCGKTFPTYCANSALAKPECLEAIRRGYTREERYRLRKKHGAGWSRIVVLRLVDERAIPTLEQARKAVADYLTIHDATPHSAADLQGMTPLQCWNTAATMRRAADRELLFLMQGRGVYKVTGNGVRVSVGSAAVAYGAGCPALQRWIGRSVFIALDPNDLSKCHAFTPDRENRKYIAALASVDPIPANATVDDLREANAAVNRRRKTMRQAERSAVKRTRNAARELTALRGERAAELRATGTDDAHANVSIVRTGFEGVSIPVSTAVEGRSELDWSDLSDLFDDDAPGLTLAEDDNDPWLDDDGGNDPSTDDDDEQGDALW